MDSDCSGDVRLFGSGVGARPTNQFGSLPSGPPEPQWREGATMSDRVNVLVIGKGGREHALAWKLAQSPRAGTVFVAPGNAGTGRDAVNVPIEPTDFDKLIRLAKK